MYGGASVPAGKLILHPTSRHPHLAIRAPDLVVRYTHGFFHASI